MRLDLRERSFGELIGLSFTLGVAHMGKLLFIIGILGLPGLAMQLLALPFQVESDAVITSREEAATRTMLMALAGLVAILLMPLQQGASILIVSGSFTGQDHSWGASLRVGLRKFLSLIAYTLVTGLIIAVGLLLLIIPGLMLITWYYVGPPALVVEDLKAQAAMTRSKELSAGRRMQIFGFVLVIGLIIGLIGGVVNVVIMRVMGYNVVSVLIAYLAGVIINIPAIVAPVVYYFQLRVVKEAFDVAALSSLVDAIEARAKAAT